MKNKRKIDGQYIRRSRYKFWRAWNRPEGMEGSVTREAGDEEGS
jgi:hypothetical protein